MRLFLEEEEWNVIFHCHRGNQRRPPCGCNPWTSASVEWPDNCFRSKWEDRELGKSISNPKTSLRWIRLCKPASCFVETDQIDTKQPRVDSFHHILESRRSERHHRRPRRNQLSYANGYVQWRLLLGLGSAQKFHTILFHGDELSVNYKVYLDKKFNFLRRESFCSLVFSKQSKAAWQRECQGCIKHWKSFFLTFPFCCAATELTVRFVPLSKTQDW